MTDSKSAVSINGQRLKKNFDELCTIGSTGDGGVHRPAFGPAHTEARKWFKRLTEEAGLEFSVDKAGNHSALLKCGKANAKRFLLGSHLDSVPHGGCFDGALGVACALEALSTIKESGISLAYDLEAVDFSDEEGCYMALMGSRALAGVLPAKEVEQPTKSVKQFDGALEEAGLLRSSLLEARRDQKSLAGYLELHVEQGRKLEDAGVNIGVVTGFVGIRGYHITFRGREDHAGSTPMDQRLDPLPAACAFILAAREMVMAEFPSWVLTVGNMEFTPGAFNVVPASVTVWLEHRADSRELLGRMRERVEGLARQHAEKAGLGLDLNLVERTMPVSTAPEMRRAVTRAAENLGLSHMEMPSGAGHDAQALGLVCPTGMLFIPSVKGSSHSSREFSHWQDCINGAQVLLNSLLSLTAE